MICDRARRLFGACWDDELTQAERDWLEGHLASCAGCRTEYDEFSRTLELAGSLPRAEAAPGLVDRVLARTRRSATAPDVVGETRGRWVPAFAAAAAAVLTVAGALLLLPHSPWRTPTDPAAVQVAGVTGGPAVATMVSQPATKPAERTGTSPRIEAGPANDVFDHNADVEFILDPVTLHRGHATVTRAGSRRTGVGGGQAIISF